MTISSPTVYRVQEIRSLTASTYVLRVDRCNLTFRAGQCVSVGVRGNGVNREYSLYSAEQEPFLEVLIREIPSGVVSPALRACRPGDVLDVEGPYSDFVLREPSNRALRYLFIATGTGIAPFTSYVKTYPTLDYQILHGVRTLNERYERHNFEESRYVSCVTSEQGGDFQGRVTDYIKTNRVDPECICYLCGNRNMIQEAYDLLRAHGVSSDQIFTEVFF